MPGKGLFTVSYSLASWYSHSRHTSIIASLLPPLLVPSPPNKICTRRARFCRVLPSITIGLHHGITDRRPRDAPGAVSSLLAHAGPAAIGRRAPRQTRPLGHRAGDPAAGPRKT